MVKEEKIAIRLKTLHLLVSPFHVNREILSISMNMSVLKP